MRVLLATGNGDSQSRLARLLEANGDEVIQVNAAGEGLLSTIGRAGRLHAAVLGQAALGPGWPGLLRRLRRQAPHLPAILLLRRGEAHAWRRAILAGAFDTLPDFESEGAVLHALSRALAYTGGKAVAEPPGKRQGIRPVGRSISPVSAAGFAPAATRT